ncbi:hypothetical protein L208DRAFT_344995 [Tricholoma matsutake]|nr:hypothetical protein L208DRAFT_344995 [Tricholoma matsutake 945]
MWELLERGNQSKKPGTCFNTYDDLFSVRKQETEDLEGLIACVSEKVHAIKDLCPSGFTLDDLDNELHSMALIRALPNEYSSFVSSLMLIDNLDRSTIHEAFRNEQLNCECHSGFSSDSTSGTALATSSVIGLLCDFCRFKGHTLPQCRKFLAAKMEARKPKRSHVANTSTTTSSTSPSSPESAAVTTAVSVAEFAGNTQAPHLI